MKPVRLKSVIFLAGLLAVILLYSRSSVSAGDQIKSSDFFVGASNVQFSIATDFPFSVYIGEDLSGVTAPVKAAFFIISGVYSGGGSLNLEINSNVSSSKTFILPSVSTPTNFEFIYRDDSNLINPTSAGVYAYTLNALPSGVAIDGFGAKLQTTHQFAPISCADGASTNEKIKTTEQFVAAANTALSTQTNYPVAVYIGDELGGVTSPMKSAYFSLSGVYTGGGSLELQIDSNASSTKTYLLPSVSAPTDFEFIYRDDNAVINPLSAGTYNYTLNVLPSGVSLYGLGIKLSTAYRYKPPSCGVGYPPFGDLVSAIFDSTASADGAAYNSLMWKGALGGPGFDTGKVRLQIAASDSSSGPWNYLGSACVGGTSDWYDLAPNTSQELGCYSAFNNKRYFRYKVRICSTDCATGGNTTPQVDDIIINWSP